MANRFWVGGSNTWNGTAGAKWSATSGGASGAAVPLASDDVFFDASSGASTITLANGMVCRSLNCTGFTGTLSHPASVDLSIGDATAGASSIALKTVAGMTYTVGSTTTSTLTFVSTSATQQDLTTGGKTWPTYTVNGVGSSYKLTDANTINAASTTTLTNGTLDTNGQTCSWGKFSSTNSNTRTLSLGASSITISASGTGTWWDCTIGTNMTLNAGTSLITLTGTNQAPTFQGGGKTYNNITKVADGGGSFIPTTFTCNNLTYNGGGGNYGMNVGASGIAVNGVLTLSGTNVTQSRLFVSSNTVGTQTTVTLGPSSTVSLTNIDFRDIAFSGTGVPVSGTSLADTVGNSGITFTTPVTRYWVGGTGNTNDTTHWSASTGGAGSAGVPICHDTMIFDANSFSAGSQTVTMNLMRTGTMTWTGATNSPTMSLNNANGAGWGLYGSLTLISAMTLSGAGNVSPNGRGTHTFTSLGKTWPALLTTNNWGGQYTFDDLVVTTSITHNAGTWVSTGAVTTPIFACNNSNVRAVTMGPGTWTLTGNATTIWNFGSATNLTFTRGNAIICNYSGATGTRTITHVNTGETSCPSFSVTAGTDTVSIGGTRLMTLDLTGFAGALTNNGGIGLYGNLVLSTGMTTNSGASPCTFYATSGTKTITSNGRTTNFPITFDGVGGTFQLVDTLTLSATNALTLTNGTFDANSQSLSIGSFASSNSNVRTLTMGSGTWTISGTGTIWNIGTDTNATVNAGTSTLVVSDTSASTKQVTVGGGGSSTLYDLSITGGGAGSVTIAGTGGTRSYHNITIGGPKTVIFNTPTTRSVSGGLILNGTAGNVVTLTSNTGGTVADFSITGASTVAYTSFQDINANPRASILATNNCTDNGNNHNVIFATPKRLATAGVS